MDTVKQMEEKYRWFMVEYDPRAVSNLCSIYVFIS